MSVEITLYAKTATKTGLIRCLNKAGFQKVRHFLPEMNTPENIHFMWYSFENYESRTGAEAMVYKSSVEDRKKYGCSEWILHTRTRSSGSLEDKQKQNEIIREARQLFGGTFYNDWYGTNKYINLKDYPKYTPLEKTISLTAMNALEKLDQIRQCLEGYSNPMSEDIKNIPHKEVRDLLLTKDPSTILYNSLIPFLVAVVEYFFSQCFIGFLKYDTHSKKSIIEEKIKIGIEDALKIQERTTSIEEIVSQSYNFQNLNSANKAFKKYTGVDIFQVLGLKKKINKKVVRLHVKLEEILDSRHRLIHELEINYHLTKDDYFGLVKTVEQSIQSILQAFRKKKIKVELHY